MLIYVILAVIFLLVFCGLPDGVKIVLTIANIFIPDPIPYVDEVIMIAVCARRLFG